MSINIEKIWMSQRNLRRKNQIASIIESIKQEIVLPPIVLSYCEDGEFQLEDGHHRLTAMWLYGKKTLEKGEYNVLNRDQWRTRCGKIEDLIKNAYKENNNV